MPTLRTESSSVPIVRRHSRASPLVLIVLPVLLGRGTRFFSDSVDPRELALVSSKATPAGVLMNTYRYLGSLRTE